MSILLSQLRPATDNEIQQKTSAIHECSSHVTAVVNMSLAQNNQRQNLSKNNTLE